MTNISTCTKNLKQNIIIEWNGNYYVIDSFLYVTSLDERSQIVCVKYPIDSETGNVLLPSNELRIYPSSPDYRIIAQNGEFLKDINGLFWCFDQGEMKYFDCQTIYNYLIAFKEAGYDVEIPESDDKVEFGISLRKSLLETEYPISIDIDSPDGYCGTFDICYALESSKQLIEDLAEFLSNRLVAFYAFSNKELKSVDIDVEFDISRIFFKQWYNENEEAIIKLTNEIKKKLGAAIKEAYEDKMNGLCK